MTTNSDFSSLMSTLSSDAHLRGKQFERIVEWWLKNTPVNPFAEHTIDQVWMWGDWPDRPGPDIGIDLVARLSDGSLCAIQAKCIDESLVIPKSQLDSFISAASPRIFAHRLLIATTDELSANARRMLQEQHVIRVMRTELEQSLAAWPASIEDLTTPIVQPKWVPRPHQKEAITNVVAGLKTHDRGQLIMACGTGKTLTALWIAEELNAHTTLVLVPSLSLLAQTLSEWAQQTKTTWSYICVCSDETVNRQDDEPISTIDDFPFVVTTDSDRIAHFIGTPGRKVIFSTYQSSVQIAIALRTTSTTIDLAICDEAHRLTGKTSGDFATILNNSKIRATKRLFMTATPRTYTAAIKRMAEERGVAVSSMDEVSIYGPVLHKLTFGEAINRELLSDYRVVIVGVTDPQVQELIDRREFVTVNDDIDIDARTLAAHIGLAQATKDYDLRRSISFHSRVNSAAKFAQDHVKILDWLPDSHRSEDVVWTATISGSMNTGQRSRLLRELRRDEPGRKALLTNARCLTEGVDVPTLDGVAFIDPRSSQVDIVQAVGRAIRKADDKRMGFIILPVLIPATADVDQALEDNAFSSIWGILNALRAHDADLDASLRELRVSVGRGELDPVLPPRVLEAFPANIDRLVPGFVKGLRVSLIQAASDSWYEWFGLLLAYVDVHGHAHVPQAEVFHDRSLGTWVNKQRMDFKRNLLSNEKVRGLEGLSGWTWDPLSTRWFRYFEALSRYVLKTGDTRVKTTAVHDGLNVGQWVATQRRRFAQGYLTQTEQLELQSLPGWTWSPLEDDWEGRFNELIAWREETGLPYPTKPRGESGHDLATWVVRQRTRFRKNWMQQDQILRLEALAGWSWKPLHDNWLQDFARLRTYVASTGTAKPPVGTTFDGADIGTWVAKQRDRRRRGRMLPAQEVLLASLPGWVWEPLDEAWLTKYKEAVTLSSTSAYTKRGEIPKHLVQWFSDQRERYRLGRISQEQQQMMEALPDWQWNPSATQWNEIFQEFQIWAQTNSPGRVQSGIMFGNVNGRQWVQNQRSMYRMGKLSADRIELLEGVRGWSWSATEGNWMSSYQLLTQLGLQNVTASPLLQWIQTQKRSYRKGSLSEERQALLESIDGWTWSVKTRDA